MTESGFQCVQNVSSNYISSTRVERHPRQRDSQIRRGASNSDISRGNKKRDGACVGRRPIHRTYNYFFPVPRCVPSDNNYSGEGEGGRGRDSSGSRRLETQRARHLCVPPIHAHIRTTMCAGNIVCVYTRGCIRNCARLYAQRSFR